jgi:hypothetical protein
MIRAAVQLASTHGGFVTHHVMFSDTKTTIPEPAQDCVAVIGMAVNMPGAPNTSQLWEILEEGINTVVEVYFNASWMHG